jgi:hypothetical protein
LSVHQGVPTDPGKQRKSDIRLLLGATIGIILGGVIIAAAILAVTSRGKVPSTRKPIAFGLASALTKNVRQGGPVNIAGASGDTGSRSRTGSSSRCWSTSRRRCRAR